MKNNKIVPMHQIGFPINVKIIIPENDLVRLLYKVTEGLDYSGLYKNYSTIGRNPVIAAEILFRILVYGYIEGIYSSRELERSLPKRYKFQMAFVWKKATKKFEDKLQ